MSLSLIKSSVSRHWWWTTLLVFASIGLCIRLGIWQLDRQTQQNAFNAHMVAVQAAPVLQLEGNSFDIDLSQMEYRAVQAQGVYDFDHQVAIRNQVWTQSWGDEPGYALLTPLALSDGNAVLVERGWIPSQYNTPESWRQFDDPGTVTVEGIIRVPLIKPEMGGGLPDPTLAPGQTRLDFWNLVHIERLQRQIPYPLLEIYIQQTPDAANTRLPYRFVTQNESNGTPHLGYAMMWFFFAALLLFGYPFYLSKQAASRP